MEKKKVLYADIALLFVAIVWGSGFVVTKNALDYVTPYHLLAFRFVISTLGNTPYVETIAIRE